MYAELGDLEGLDDSCVGRVGLVDAPLADPAPVVETRCRALGPLLSTPWWERSRKTLDDRDSLKVLRSILVALLLAPVGVVAPTVAAAQEVEAPPPSGWVAPVEVVLNDDGAWSWFQDERAILDGCDLIVGSVPAGEGVGGAARQGNVELSTVDLGSMSVRRDVLDPRIDGDDHAAPAVIKMPDGGLVGAWSRHSKDRLTRFGQRRADGLMWEQRGHVTRGALVTYSNLHLLTGEGQSGRLYQLFRAEGSDTNILASDDGGGSWSDLGRLFTTRAGSRPYVKYVDDGFGRLHFIATNGHPREEPGGTSVYHGYIEGGLLHQSDGTPLAPIGAPLVPADFTPIAQGHPQLRYWLADLELDASGHPVAVLTRTDTATGYSHSYVHARFDGSSWQVGELAYAGSSLYDGERYYTGLAAVDPASTDRVVVSTDVDPATGDPLVSSADGQQHWELFEATTADDWVSWSWQALTTNSTFDNLRPIIPRGVVDGRIMVWFRGSYSSFSVYSTEVVAWAEGTWSPETCPARERVAVERAYSPLTGDFDGDGRGDIFWYGPGSAADMVSYAAPERSFGSSAVKVSGSYVPVSGDFDGDGAGDAFWYQPGSAPESRWWGSGTGLISG